MSVEAQARLRSAGLAPEVMPQSRAIPRAVTLILMAGVTSSLLHIGVRYVSPHLPTLEIVFLRSTFTILCTLPIIMWNGQLAWRTSAPRLQLVRGLVGVTSMSMWYYALGRIPLADAGVLSFTTPIFVMIGAALFFGEQIGPRRWIAVMVGLLGATIVLRPGSGVISIPALLAAGSSVLWAVSLLIAKRLVRYDSALTTTFYQPLLIAPIAGLLAIPGWVAPPTWALLTIFGMGLVAGIGNYAYIRALRMADASITMPADYVRLVWMSSWGFALFGEVPGLATWAGAVLIMSSTLFITLRERQLAKAREAATS